MPKNDNGRPPGPSPGHKRLDAFVGAWHTEGEIRAGPSGPAARMRATDIYEWLPGGYFLIHRLDAHMPDGDMQGIEIIGYDVSSQTYPMHSFDSHGTTGIMHARVDGDRWTFTGELLRFAGGFRDGGRTFAGTWEQRSSDSEDWRPWMDITLTRAE